MEPATETKRSCWNPRYLLFALAMALVVIGAALIARQFPRGSWQRIGLALVEGVATGVTLVMPFNALKTMDELQQKIHLEALALAFFGTGILGVGYGFLESAGMPQIDWGALIWPVMAGLWALGLVIAGRRYR